MTYRAKIEYDGTEFAGIQYQIGERTVQGVVEQGIEKLTGQVVRINVAGRTDAGVHALGQVISFSVENTIPLDKWPLALNGVLPKDVSIVEIAEVDDGFHARFSATSRTYFYAVLNRRLPSAVWRRYSWFIPRELDVPLMNQAAEQLIGEKDFAAWANSSAEARTTQRRVLRARWRRAGDFVVFRIEANAFLKGMVRNLVGTLVQVGQHDRPAHDVKLITESRDRREAGPTAPPQGLFLVRVSYTGDKHPIKGMSGIAP